eukprot:49967_1
MASQIDWSLDSSIIRKKLLILSTKKLKQLCKSLNVQYSIDKLDTISNLIDTKKTSLINESKPDTPLNIETKQHDTSIITHAKHTNDCKENKTADVVLKVSFLGDRQIGKKTLMVKYIEDRYDEDYTETLSVNFMEKIIRLKNMNVTISIWNLRSNFIDFMPLICANAKVIIFLFDLTNKASLLSVKRYYKESRKESKTFMAFLVGSKYDLYQEKDIEYKLNMTKLARKFASKMNSPLIYCSSLMNINIKKIFKLIIAKCFDFQTKNERN